MVVTRAFVANFVGTGSIKISGIAKSLLTKVLAYRGTGSIKTSGVAKYSLILKIFSSYWPASYWEDYWPLDYYILKYEGYIVPAMPMSLRIR
jgi:hypothetical protein